MDLQKGLDKYSNLSREEYFKKNQELSENLWENENSPTIADIAQFIKGEENEKINNVFNFFDNQDDFIKMASRVNHNYNQDESTSFIKKVMSANNEEISKAGYFYKLLMASADDFIIKENDCKSKGIFYNLNDLNQDIFNYRIKFLYVTEYKGFMRLNYSRFLEWAKENNIQGIHVRTPLSCNCSTHHYICKRCAGALPHNTTNIGTFTALMVTEHATQSALSSMNKGTKENINDLLALGYTGNYNWDEIVNWINEIVEKLSNQNVSSRFYEIALLSRIREDKYGPFVASLKSSINHSNNLFGAYIFNPTMKNFENIIRKKYFEDNSLKLQIAINDCRKRE